MPFRWYQNMTFTKIHPILWYETSVFVAVVVWLVLTASINWLSEYITWSTAIGLPAVLWVDFRICENTIHNKSCYLIFPNSDLAKEYNQILIPLLLDYIWLYLVKLYFPGWLFLKNFRLLFLHYQKLCTFHTRSTAVLFYEPLELQLILANRIKCGYSDTPCYTYTCWTRG